MALLGKEFLRGLEVRLARDVIGSTSLPSSGTTGFKRGEYKEIQADLGIDEARGLIDVEYN